MMIVVVVESRDKCTVVAFVTETHVYDFAAHFMAVIGIMFLTCPSLSVCMCALVEAYSNWLANDFWLKCTISLFFQFYISLIVLLNFFAFCFCLLTIFVPFFCSGIYFFMAVNGFL